MTMGNRLGVNSGTSVVKILLAGGASWRRVRCRIGASIMGRRAKAPDGVEHGTRRTILAALAAMGLHPRYPSAIARPASVERTNESDPGNHAVHSQLLDLDRNIRMHLMGDGEQPAAVLNGLAGTGS